MMVDGLDLGWWPAIVHATSGSLTGDTGVEGAYAETYSRGRAALTVDAHFWIMAWQALGAQAALSLDANRLLRMQLAELTAGRPVFIRWARSAQTGGPASRNDALDGWYLVDSLGWDPETWNHIGAVEAALTATRLAPPPPARTAFAYASNVLETDFSAGNLSAAACVGFPHGSTVPYTYLRTGAEGSVPIVRTYADADPIPAGLSSTESDWWLGGCRVWDTVDTASHPVPTDGTARDADWVEVFGADHAYAGDCVLSDGLLLVLVRQNVADLASVWHWNTALATPAWQALGVLDHVDSGTDAYVRGYGLERLDAEQVAAVISLASAAGGMVEYRLRLKRGSRQLLVRMASSQTDYSGATTTGLRFTPTVGSGKLISYNRWRCADGDVNTTDVTRSSEAASEGWSGAFFPSDASRTLFGLTWLNVPPAQGPPIGHAVQPYWAAGSPGYFSPADGASAGLSRIFGLWACPLASPANYQSEAESGTLGTGWTSTTDGGRNVAKCAAGTASGSADTFGTAFALPSGAVDVYVLMRVASGASATAEMTVGLWDATTSAWVASGSTNLAPNAVGTTPVWVKVTNPTTGAANPGTDQVRVRAQTSGTLATDWYLDEAVVVPRANFASHDGPQDHWYELLADVDVHQVRL